MVKAEEAIGSRQKCDGEIEKHSEQDSPVDCMIHTVLDIGHFRADT